jgi:hypothetical protein
MTNITDLEVTTNSQEFFDSFNKFILSNDTRTFNKLIARTLLYNEVKDIPGDIVECGVFKGTGLYTFLKLKRLFNPNSSKKIIGFDFFDTNHLISSIKSKTDKEAMSVLFKERNFEHKRDFDNVLHSKLNHDGFFDYEFYLIKGDVSKTTKQFSEDNPGLKISLLYMDVDLEIPTYNTLVNLWDNISYNGLIVFDEYGYHKWSESKGVDRFVKERGLELKSLNYICPTAYIKKVL